MSHRIIIGVGFRPKRDGFLEFDEIVDVYAKNEDIKRSCVHTSYGTVALIEGIPKGKPFVPLSE